jgi:hypothetical protein
VSRVGLRLAGVALGVLACAVVGGVLLFAGGDAIVVRKVLIDVDPGPAAAGIDREQVRAVVDRVLADGVGVRVDADHGERGLRVRVESFSRSVPAALPAGHPVVEDSAAPASLTLAVDVVEGGRVVLRGSSTTTASGVTNPEALVDVALREALVQVVEAGGTDGLDDDELLAVLADASAAPQRRRRAMQALAARRDRRATPLITPFLTDPEASLRAAALQSLALLADPSAVEAIIAYSERQPPAVRRQCIDAVRSTDSPLAAAWLFVLSTGHPDIDVQAHARAALAALPASPTAATTANRAPRRRPRRRRRPRWESG